MTDTKAFYHGITRGVSYDCAAVLMSLINWDQFGSICKSFSFNTIYSIYPHNLLESSTSNVFYFWERYET